MSSSGLQNNYLQRNNSDIYLTRKNKPNFATIIFLLISCIWITWLQLFLRNLYSRLHEKIFKFGFERSIELINYYSDLPFFKS